jgi:2,4'-dihydroxyacetophenone dioxygenase
VLAVSTLSHALPGFDAADLQISENDMPWVPNGQGLSFKPLHFSPAAGWWVNLIRVERGGHISRHCHLAPVQGYVLQGAWRYLEHDWTAEAGSYVWEPAGDVHTLEVLGDETMITLFTVHGAIQYLDDDGNLVQQDDARSRAELYVEHCRRHGIEPQVLVS